MQDDRDKQISRHDLIAEEYDERFRGNARNHLRKLQVLLEHIKPRKSWRILEVGVGSGLHFREIRKYSRNIVGIDISKRMLAEARKKCKDGRLVLADAENTPFKDNSFDMVYTISTLHHADYKKSIREFSRICKPGGKIGITEPNPLNPQQFLGAMKNYSIEKGTFRMSLKNIEREFNENGICSRGRLFSDTSPVAYI
jgi:ubiquinone/menaquinone biosynthesis C-methylase UbiE